jgi:hypothetical protein
MHLEHDRNKCTSQSSSRSSSIKDFITKVDHHHKAQSRMGDFKREGYFHFFITLFGNLFLLPLGFPAQQDVVCDLVR